MAKALRVFSRLETVDQRTQLIDPDSAQRIIATVDRDLLPVTREQATSLVAELLGAYPGVKGNLASDEQRRDFQVYTVKLFEAFSAYSFVIGKAAVHGATGIPSKQRFKPQPSDIVDFCEAEKHRRLDVKTMAQRHIAESQRRQRERAEAAELAKGQVSPEQRKAFVEQTLKSFRAMPVGDDL